MKVFFTTCGLVAALAFSPDAHAQQLTLKLGNGRVTLDATNVSVRQILAEWARVGGTKVVGGEKIIGPALTLKLVDVPERQALDIILRNVAGFMAAPRPVDVAVSGASTYDRILVMATSAGAAQASAGGRPGALGAATSGMAPGTQRRVPSRPPNVPPSPAQDTQDDDDQPGEQDAAGNPTPPTFVFPPAGGQNPGFVPMQNGQFGTAVGTPGVAPAPVINLQPGPNGPVIYNFPPNGAQPAQPGFTVIGAPTPGMMQAPPPQPQQPGAPNRPPG